MAERDNGFNDVSFMVYLEKAFNGFDNTFLRGLVGNLVEYGLMHERVSKDQFCYWLSDLLPEVSFGEVAAFMDDECLTTNGKREKQEAIKDYEILNATKG